LSFESGGEKVEGREESKGGKKRKGEGEEETRKALGRVIMCFFEGTLSRDF